MSCEAYRPCPEHALKLHRLGIAIPRRKECDGEARVGVHHPQFLDAAAGSYLLVNPLVCGGRERVLEDIVAIPDKGMRRDHDVCEVFWSARYFKVRCVAYDATAASYTAKEVRLEKEGKQK